MNHIKTLISLILLNLILLSCSYGINNTKKLKPDDEPALCTVNTQWSIDEETKHLKKNYISKRHHDSFGRVREETEICTEGAIEIQNTYTYFSDDPKTALFSRQFKTGHIFKSEGKTVSAEKWKYRLMKSGDVELVFRSYKYTDIISWTLENEYREFPANGHRLVKMTYNVKRGKYKPGSEWNSGFIRSWDYRLIGDIPVPVKFNENSSPVIELEWIELKNSGKDPLLGRTKKFYSLNRAGFKAGSCIIPLSTKKTISLFGEKKIEFNNNKPIQDIAKKFPPQENNFISQHNRSGNLVLFKNNLFLKKWTYHGKFVREFSWLLKNKRAALTKFKHSEYNVTQKKYTDIFHADISYTDQGQISREEWKVYDPNERRTISVFLEEFEY